MTRDLQLAHHILLDQPIPDLCIVSAQDLNSGNLECTIPSQAYSVALDLSILLPHCRFHSFRMSNQPSHKDEFSSSSRFSRKGKAQ